MSFNGLSGNASSGSGNVPPKLILPNTETTGDLTTSTAVAQSIIGNKNLSGALTADTYKEMVSLSDSGILRLCGAFVLDTTSRTVGLKIVIDGTTVYDHVSPAITTTSEGFYSVGYGAAPAGQGFAAFESFQFNNSLSISVKSSLSETDKVGLIYLTAV